MSYSRRSGPSRPGTKSSRNSTRAPNGCSSSCGEEHPVGDPGRRSPQTILERQRNHASSAPGARGVPLVVRRGPGVGRTASVWNVAAVQATRCAERRTDVLPIVRTELSHVGRVLAARAPAEICENVKNGSNVRPASVERPNEKPEPSAHRRTPTSRSHSKRDSSDPRRSAARTPRRRSCRPKARRRARRTRPRRRPANMRNR